MGNGTAPPGEKGISEAANNFQDITSLSLLAVYKNIGTFIRIVEERNILIRWNLAGKAAGMFQFILANERETAYALKRC